MTTFNPSKYGPVVADLLGLARTPDLGPGSPVQSVKDKLRSFDPSKHLGTPANDLDAARACHSGLWLLFDFLNESHSISQDLGTGEGSFWHALMHRREPDAFNSKYWWRKVGPHPVLKALAEQAPSLGYDYTNPFDFVDFCERVRGTSDESQAKQVQLLEWRLLFDHCYKNAVLRG